MGIAAVLAVGQQSVGAEKVATLGDEAGMAAFNEKLDELIVEMLKRPETTYAFVALSGQDSQSVIAKLKSVRGLVKARPELKRRISYTRIGVKYDAKWMETEFWLVPDKSDPPYVARIHDIECAILEIQGETIVEKTAETLEYSTNYPSRTWLDEPITFQWTVKGGKIVSGQGTQSITVEMDRRKPEKVVVELKVAGWDDAGVCSDNISFTSTIVEKLPKEY